MFAALNKFGRLGAPAGRSLDAQIAALFADGVVFDPSDFSALYQDSAGTTPVTALEQPVGLMLDKSRGLVLGAELVTNGDFSNGTTGWAATRGATIAVVSGALRVTQDAANDYVLASQAVTLVIGQWYRLSVDFVGGTASNVQVGIGTNNTAADATVLATSASPKTFTLYFAATATTMYVRASINVTTNDVYADFDNFSLKAIPGAHAYHTPGDTTTRPVVSRRINLLTKTEQFDDAAWTKSSASVSANSAIAPDGTSTAESLIEAAATALHNAFVSLTYVASEYVVSCYFKKLSASRYAQIRIRQTLTSGTILAVATFNLDDGSVVGTPVGTASAQSVGNGWYRCAIRFTATAGAFETGILITTLDGTASYTGDGTSGIYVWGASLVPADLAALPYQRVNTTTDYDTSSVFPTFLRCDGVNDSLQTSAIDFTGTDKMFVGVAVRKTNTSAAFNCLIETASNGANGFGVFAPDSNNNNYSFWLKAQSRPTKNSVYVAPITNVISVEHDCSQATAVLQTKTRINGAAVEISPTAMLAASGNFANEKFYLFARGGTSLPANIWFFGSLIKGATLSASQIALAERWLASKTKTVTL